MPRPLRYCPGGVIYHVLNRANGRSRIFSQTGDYLAFERVLEEALQRTPLDLLAYCIMPNHWHLVLRPHEDGELPTFVAWASMTHAQRWHAHRDTAGTGHVYQGRYKAFPVQSNHYLLKLLAYVERNPLRAGLVRRSKHWRWSSLWRRESGIPEKQSILGAWPIAPRPDWSEWIDGDSAALEEDNIRRSIRESRPFGDDNWVAETATSLGLESTLLSPGRPRKNDRKKGSGAFS